MPVHDSTIYESEIEGTNPNVQRANSISVSGTFNINTNGEGTSSMLLKITVH